MLVSVLLDIMQGRGYCIKPDGRALIRLIEICPLIPMSFALINKRRRALLLSPALLLLAQSPLRAASTYQKMQVDGWTLMLDHGPRTADAASRSVFIAVLTDQLNKLKKLPVQAQSSLRAVSIYVSSGTYRAFGAQHHPSSQSLQ